MRSWASRSMAEKPVVLKTAQDREEYRKSLHKSSCSPGWKTTYRQRCLERLKASRDRFRDRFRAHTSGEAGQSVATGDSSATERTRSRMSEEELVSSVQEVMMEEWEQLRSEQSDLPRFPSACSHQLGGRYSVKRRASSPSHSDEHSSVAKRTNQDTLVDSDDDSLYDGAYEDIDSVLSVMDEITRELIKEEQAILAQCYESEVEDALCSAIECLSTSNDIVCPVCQKNILHQNKHIIFCKCGVRVDTAQDGITLDYVQRQLEDCYSQHSQACEGVAVFSLEETLGLQNIIMNCTVCDFMEIIV